jgi:hypothetical protein
MHKEENKNNKGIIQCNQYNWKEKNININKIHKFLAT